MRIGQLADQVAKVYRENRLKQFADAIGVAECTVGRYRSVYRAWQTTDNKSAPEPICYSVAKALQAVPNRFELIRQNPNLSKRAAEKIKRQHAAELKGSTATVDPAVKNHKHWFEALVERARKIRQDAAIANPDAEVSPELREQLRDGIEPKLLPTLREDFEAGLKLVDFFEELTADEPSEQQLQTAE